MNAPIYENDLTTIHPRHTVPLLRLRDRTQSASAALGAAEHEKELGAVLAVLNRIAKVVRGLFAEGEVWQPDQPFADFDFGLGARAKSDATDGRSPDPDEEEESASIYSESAGIADGTADCPCFMQLTSTCCLGLCDLRRLYDIYYAIHLCRLNRLVLRLPACISSSTEDESSQYTQSISFSGDGPHARQSGAGDPLSEEAAARYAEVLADEISLVAEFREVILEVVVSRHGEDGTLWCCPCCCRRCYIGHG